MAERTDGTEEEILALAKQADDAKDRAYLLLLLRINASLEANTAATQDISTDIQTHRDDFEQHRVEFRQHVIDEAALMNQGKGAWKVTAVVLSIAQVAGFALATWYVRQQGETTMELKNLNTAIIQAQAKEREMDVTDHALATRIERIERKLFGQ